MSLGLGERLTGLVTGLGQGLWQAPGLIADFATAPFNDEDDFNGFWNTIASRSLVRAGNTFEELAQGGSGLSAITHQTSIGSGLEEIRGAVGSLGASVARGWENIDEWGGQHVREPLSAMLLAGSLADSPTFTGGDPGVSNLLRRDTWNTANRLAEDISVGQAFWLVFTRDILDPEEAAEFRDTGLFRYGSGTVDAVTRFFLDPDVLAGKALKGARTRYLIRDLRTPKGNVIDPAKVDAYFSSPRWERHNAFLERLDAKPAGEKLHTIAQEFFPADPWAFQKAAVIAKGVDRQSRELLLRATMADMRAVVRLEQTVDELRGIHATLRSAQQVTTRGTPTRLTAAGTRLADQLDTAILDVRRTYIDEGIVTPHLSPGERADALFDILNDPSNLDRLDAAIRETERLIGATDLTFSAVGKQATELHQRSPLYRFFNPNGPRDTAVFQTSAYDTPTRFVNLRYWAGKTAHRPHPIVDADHPNVGEQVERMLRSAGVDEKTRGKWVDTVLNQSPGTYDRVNMFNAAVQVGMRAAAKDAGVPADQITTILAKMNDGRDRAHRLVQHAYAAGGRDLVPIEDPAYGRFLVALPMTASQHPQYLTVPDFSLIIRDLRRYNDRGWIPAAGSKVKDISDSVFDGITWHWKANVILRMAWPIRTTLLDEQFRMMAKWGAAVSMKNLAVGAKNIAPAYMKELGLNTPRAAGRAGTAVGGLLGFGLGGPGGGVAGAALGRTAGLRMAANLAKVEERGFTQLTKGLDINGVSVPPAFGEPGDVADLYRRKVSSEPQLEHFLINEHGIMRRLRRDSGKYGDIKPHEAQHESEWLRVLNRQWRSDGLVKRILAGDTIDDQVKWLGSADGQEYLRRIPEVRKRDTETWLEGLNAYVLDTVPTPELRALLTERRVTGKDLARLFPDPATRPVIHGAMVDEMLGRSPWMKFLGDTIAKSMKLMGAMPTDYLVRQPSFEIFYRQHMERLLGGRTSITEAEMNRLARNARDGALVDAEQLVYDLAERREFHHLLRNHIPFMAAAEEVVTGWAKLSKENPAFAVRAVKFWTGIDKFDEIAWTDPDTGETYITVTVPGFAEGLLAHSPIFRHAADDLGRIRLPKAGFNMILQSPLGFGPWAQASVSTILKHKPELEDSLRFMIPFGASESVTDAFLAGWQRRVKGRIKGLDDRSYAAAWNRTLQHRLALMRQGDMPEIDWDDPVAARKFLDGVAESTNAVWNVAIFASFASPVTPAFDSPLWPYAEMYSALQEVHGEKALELFVDQVGEELTDVATALSRSNDGIPPTLEALATRREFADIIERYPDLGGFIVGTDVDTMASKFSGAVYDHQLTTPVAPGAPTLMRERMSPRERADAPDVSLGWIKYSRLMDYIEAERISRGLPNIQVKEAQDLALMKKVATEEIAAEHPGWAKVRETFDLNAFNRRLEGFRAIAAEPKLQGRLEVQAVQLYLDARDVFTTELQRRLDEGGSGNLFTMANADLESLWREVIGDMVERHPGFGPVFYRYFERDPMIVERGLTLAQQEVS